MINEQLINPKSIVIVGGSNDTSKPGGKILKNILDGNFKGELYVTNLKENEVQGIKSYNNLRDLPDVDLAVIAIAAKWVPDTVEILSSLKNTRAFIIISAGFSEESPEGKILEDKIVETVNAVNGALIGPNCTGILTPNHQSIFTLPIPKLAIKGCSLISGSGATACFIMEPGIANGLIFSSLFSVGNSAQMGVEEVVKYMDETYDTETSAEIKLLYIESIDKPEMLLRHTASLIQKGCRIAAIKAGVSEAGSRAASSHTGALASSDTAVEALFRKAGIVRCYSREEMVAVGSVFMHKKLRGRNIAVISHAGGPAVMLTDALEKGGLKVPHIEGGAAEELKEKLFPGASVANPIDFLATGNAEQLGIIIDYVDQKFDNIDAMVVIFGTPGLREIYDVYDMLHEKMKTSSKPIFPVLPSVTTANKEIDDFISKGRVFFPDEVMLGRALAEILNTPPPASAEISTPDIDKERIRDTINESVEGYLEPSAVQQLLDAAGIPRIMEQVARNETDAINAAREAGFPVVMKVVGPVHKSDVGGVVLNIENGEEVIHEFKRMMDIPETTGVLIQPMISGIELFAGGKKEDKFGHLVLFGLGGIYIEVLSDVKAVLAPAGKEEIRGLIKELKAYKVIEGVRGQRGVNEELFIDIVWRLSGLLEAAPEIAEMDLNPLIASGDQIVAVDARIRIEG